MRKYTIAVDVDDTVADLLMGWLMRNNEKTGDSVLPEDLTRWDIASQVSNGTAIFDVLREPRLYAAHVYPIHGARAAVRALRDAGHRVVFVTSCPEGTHDQKINWLVDWGFLEEGRTQRDFVATSDKSLVRANILIDDNVDFIKEFPGCTFLINRPHNQNHQDRHWAYYIVNGIDEAARRILRPDFSA